MPDMTDKPVKVPGPDHPITVTPAASRIVVRVGEHVVADSRSALNLKEASYPAVAYIPRADVDMSLLERSDHRTYCPYKGDAGYFSIPAAGAAGDNAVWTYETPYDAVAPIKEHVAFYPTKVTIEELPL
jgi:uncharacterized protein (DUF427 family)